MIWRLTTRIWEGSTAFVVGGGPSISSLNLDSLQGQNVVAVNNAYKLMPWAPAMFFMDNVWFTWHRSTLVSFGGLKVCTAHQYKEVPWLLYLDRGPIEHFSLHPTKLSTGGCSGHGGISLAIRFGAQRIILLGFDMRVVNGRHNYHDDHRRHVGVSAYTRHFLRPLKLLADYTKANNIEVLNATLGSALDCWPIVDPAEWVEVSELAA